MQYKTRYLSTVLIAICLTVGTPSYASDIIRAKGYQGQIESIRYAAWGGALELNNAKIISRKFVEKHPNISVEIAIYPWGQYWQKIQTQTASGLAPDVISIFCGNFGTWASRGALLPLDKYVKKSGIKLSDYYRVAVENCTWKDKLYCMPIEIPMRTLVYNQDKFEQAGIPRSEWPSPNTSMPYDKFVSLCRKLTLRQPDGTFVQYGIAATDINASLMTSLYGGKTFDHPVNPTKSFILGNEAMIKGCIKVYKTQYAERIMMPPAGIWAANVGLTADNMILNQRYAMCTVGSWGIADLVKSGLHFGLARLPQGPHPYQSIGVNSVGIYSASKHKDAAWELVRYMASYEPECVVGRHLKGIPTLKTARDSVIHNAYGVKGCEAYINDLAISEPNYVTDNDILLQPSIKWGSRIEQTIEQEYDTRYRELYDNGQKTDVTNAEYAAFKASMGTFIEKTIRDSIPAYDKEQKEAFKMAIQPHYGFTTRVIGPIIFFIAIVVLLIGYVGWVRKQNKVEVLNKRLSNVTGYAFISPWLIGLVCFGLGPILASILLSFTEWNMITAPKWVGLGNYLSLIHDRLFLVGLQRTFLYAVIAIPVSLIGGLLTAALLTARIRGSSIFKAIIYFPALFTGAEAAVLWLNIYNKENGVLNRLLGYIGIAPINWMDEAHVFFAIILMGVFWIGGAMIIYYAGMKQIPDSLYEAAEIDGASYFRKFFSITVPLLSPVILFMVIMGTIGAFQIFTPALFFSGGSTVIGGPGDALRFYSVLIYSEAFNNLHMGKACCLALVLFGVIFIATMIQMKLSKRFVYVD